MKPLRNFWKLSPPDRIILLQTYLLLTLIRLGLWLVPFERLWKLSLKLGQRPAKAVLPAKTDVQIVRQIVWAVNLSARFTPGGAKCLARALTTKVLLDQRRCPSLFKIGVAKDASGGLDAHAWIEFQGHVVMGQVSKLSEYTSLPPLPI